MSNDARMRFYTSEKLGPKREMTPDGFLVCYDVPIGRVGPMTYGPGETPVKVGSDGLAIVDRDADELFRPETVASFNGKSVTKGHPPVNVKPENWKQYTIGIATNPRQGSGDTKDLMLADLFITCPGAIQDIIDKQWEVSSGYDADYEQFSPGKGRQYNIIGNHIALVEFGRCGSRCAIGDQRREVMQKPFVQRIKDFVSSLTTDSAKQTELESILADAPRLTRDEEGGIHIHAGGEGRTRFTDEALEQRFAANDAKHQTHDEALTGLGERVKQLEAGGQQATGDRRRTATDQEMECPKCNGTGKIDGEECPKCKGSGVVEKTEDARRPVRDAAFMDAMALEVPTAHIASMKTATTSELLEAPFHQTVSVAEIISPGLHMPTFDRAADPVKTYGDICGTRRKALQQATKDSVELVKEARGGRTLDESEVKNMTCVSVHDLFFSVGALKRRANNAPAPVISPSGVQANNKIKNPKDLNEYNRSVWGPKAN